MKRVTIPCLLLLVLILLCKIQTSNGSNSIRGATPSLLHVENPTTRELAIDEVLSQGQQTACFQAFASNDENGDNAINRTEYLRVIAELSLGAIDEVEFQQLPPSLRSNFIRVYLASTGGPPGFVWNVQGSKLPEPATGTPSLQLQFLEYACRATIGAIESVLPPSSITTPVPITPSPSIAPPPAPTLEPSAFLTSYPSIEPSNTPSTTPSATPSLVPTSVSSIEPSAMPSLVPTALSSLEPSETPSLVLTAVSSLEPSSSATSLQPSTQKPTFVASDDNILSLELEECYNALVSADLNKDSWLNQTEYVLLLQQFTSLYMVEPNTPFQDLPLLLQANFHQLANGTSSSTTAMEDRLMAAGHNNIFVRSAQRTNDAASIWIYGARQHNDTTANSNTTTSQEQHLQDVCNQTQLVLSTGVSLGTTTPTMAPTFETLIVSEFVISTNNNNTLNSSHVEELELAYDMVASRVVDSLNNDTTQQEQGMTFVQDSGTIDVMENTTCPPSDGGDRLCQQVSASFFIRWLQDGSSQSNSMKELVSTAMDEAIESGDLQQALLEINPDSPILVLVERDEEEETDDNVYSGGFQEGTDRDQDTFWLVLGIVCCGQAVFVGIAVFVCLRRENKDKLADENKEAVDQFSAYQAQGKDYKKNIDSGKGLNQRDNQMNGNVKKQKSSQLTGESTTEVTPASVNDPARNHLLYENVSFNEPAPPGVLDDISSSSCSSSPRRDDEDKV